MTETLGTRLLSIFSINPVALVQPAASQGPSGPTILPSPRSLEHDASEEIREQPGLRAFVIDNLACREIGIKGLLNFIRDVRSRYETQNSAQTTEQEIFMVLQALRYAGEIEDRQVGAEYTISLSPRGARAFELGTTQVFDD